MASNTRRYGERLTLQPGWEVTEDRYGRVTSAMTWLASYELDWDSVVSYAYPSGVDVTSLISVEGPEPGQFLAVNVDVETSRTTAMTLNALTRLPHPRYAGKIFFAERTTRYESGHYVISSLFHGVEDDQIDSRKYKEMSSAVSEEPIATHPEFSDFAGTPAVPLNGAIFVDARGEPTKDNNIGLFKAFAAWSPLAGMETFMSPSNTTLRIRWTSKTRPAMTGVGEKAINPGGIAPPAGGYAWMKMAVNWNQDTVDDEESDIVYSVVEEYKLSGKRGLSALVY